MLYIYVLGFVDLHVLQYCLGKVWLYFLKTAGHYFFVFICYDKFNIVLYGKTYTLHAGEYTPFLG